MDEPSDEVIKEFFGLSNEDIAALDEWLHALGAITLQVTLASHQG